MTVVYLLGKLIIVLFLVIISIISIFLLIKYSSTKKSSNKQEGSIIIVVIGDVGRSPRMQNHAICASKKLCKKVSKVNEDLNIPMKLNHIQDNFQLKNYHIYLMGYRESKCSSLVIDDPNISVVELPPSKINSYKYSIPLFAFFTLKIIEQTASILKLAFKVPNLSGIILQVPPSIPAIPVLWFVSFLRGVPLIIDWHNYGHTLLIQTKPHQNSNMHTSFLRTCYQYILRIVYESLEFSLGKLASLSFCVTRAMKNDLARRGIEASVLYDRPNSSFNPINSVSKRHELLFKYFAEGTSYSGESYEITDVLDIVLESPCMSFLYFTNYRYSKDSNLKPLDNNEYTIKLESMINEKFSYKYSLTDFEAWKLNNKSKFTDQIIGNKDEYNIQITECSPITNLSVKFIKEENYIRCLLEVNLKKSRPAIIITSTSWTPDEDLDLLLDSLVEYDKLATNILNKSVSSPNIQNIPDLFVIITGKGPCKRTWLERARKAIFKHIKIRTIFTIADDYPKLLACADLGISLHYSSSGFDLPMKVVDMIGAGIPTLSYYFPVMKELLQDDKFDLFFSSSNELCYKLATVLSNFGNTRTNTQTSEVLEDMRMSIIKGRPQDFDIEWTQNVLGELTKCII
ncbi:glycosyl transferase, group 1 family protein [Cryptosporidium serpentis]